MSNNLRGARKVYSRGPASLWWTARTDEIVVEASAQVTQEAHRDFWPMLSENDQAESHPLGAFNGTTAIEVDHPQKLVGCVSLLRRLREACDLAPIEHAVCGRERAKERGSEGGRRRECERGV